MITRHLIRQARRRAGLTQADLAGRLATTQSAVARWESGGSTPSFEALRRIVVACGLQLRYSIGEANDAEWSLAQQNLALTPVQRLDQLTRTVAFMRAGRAAISAGAASKGGAPAGADAGG